MKFLGKLSLLAAAILSTNAMAYRIISETTRSTPGFDVKWTHDMSSSIVKKSMSVGSATRTHDVEGRQMQYLMIDSDHGLKIKNDKGKTLIYTLTYNLKCLNSVSEHIQNVEIDKDEYFDSTVKAFATLQDNRIGEFPIYASTILSGNGFNDTAISSANAKLRLNKR